MPVLARLELETHAYHREADQPWLALLSPGVTRARYIEQLQRAYGLEQPLEAALGYTPHLSSMVAPRRRARLLARDLAVLDVSALAPIPRCWIAPFPSLAEAFGWLYVVERSARLHAMVCGNVIAHLPELGSACSYLNDGTAVSRWRELGSAVDRVARTPRIEDELLAAAHSAFRVLIAWHGTRRQALRLGA